MSLYRLRIIPTRMGTSAYLSRGKHCHKDHPHAYGDKFLTKNGYLSDEGSSPRVWGQVLSVESKILFQRIIPTRMGTSIRLFEARCRYENHPHAYGDKQGSISPSNDFIGSSPRVWGQVFVRRLQIFLLRIIPTRMGTSFCKTGYFIFQKDHPHAYGDKVKIM